MSESFEARLRRLRRERATDDGTAPEPAPEPRGELPVWLRARLAARSRREREAAVTLASSGAHRTTLGPPRDLEQHEGSAGPFAARLERYELEQRHGSWTLAEVDGVSSGVFSLLTGDESLAELDPGAVTYLDIETTGLAGGAGIHPYMVGLGTFRSEGGRRVFELWQGFLRGPEEERALLAECAERVAASQGLVSFFGKSFDRHRLEDKMRLFGVPPPFEGRPHLDLYYPLRKLYGEALPDGRLSTLETALCGVEREADLPGSFAPAAWYDFLTGRPHLLEEVFRHNKDDVLSLVTLLASLGRALTEQRAGGAPLEAEPRLALARAAGLAREFARRRSFEPALCWTERALEREPAAPARRDLALLRGEMLRRLGRREEALARFEELLDGVRDAAAARACFEASRLRERSDPERALELGRRAGDLAAVTLTGGSQAELQRRARGLTARLEQRLAKGG